MKVIILLGPAGSGKSVLAGVLTNVLRDQGYDALILNLDPAARVYPYDAPDIDIRQFVRAERVMRKFGLGPNGGLIASIDIAAKFAGKIKKEIMEYDPEFLIVDTPGQLEIFVFRYAGSILLKNAILEVPGNIPVGVFLFDPTLCDNLNSMLSLLLLAASVELRIEMPMIGALTKIDLYPEAKVKEVWDLLSNPRKLLLKTQLEGHLSPIRRIDPVVLRFDIWPISSITGEGLNNLVIKILDIVGEE